MADYWPPLLCLGPSNLPAMAKRKMPAGLRRYMLAKKKARKGRKASKRRRAVANRKPAPRRATPRKMAKRKTKGGRRRSTGGRASLQNTFMRVLGTSIGYFGVGAVVDKIPVNDPLMKGLVIAGAGTFGATKTSGMVQDIMVGAASRGLVAAGQQALPGVVNGIGNLPAQLPPLSQDDVDQLHDMLLNGTEYQENLMGYEDDEDLAPVLDIDERGGALMGDDDGGDDDGAEYMDDNA